MAFFSTCRCFRSAAAASAAAASSAAKRAASAARAASASASRFSLSSSFSRRRRSLHAQVCQTLAEQIGLQPIPVLLQISASAATPCVSSLSCHADYPAPMQAEAEARCCLSICTASQVSQLDAALPAHLQQLLLEPRDSCSVSTKDTERNKQAPQGQK